MYLRISHILKLQNGISVLNVSAGFKITLCGHNLKYGKTKQCAIWQLELQNWAAKRNFPQSKRKSCCRFLWNVFILSCYFILFVKNVFEGQLSLSNINRTSTFNIIKLLIKQEPTTPGDNHSMQMKAVQNVNKVLCREYKSLDTNWY